MFGSLSSIVGKEFRSHRLKNPTARSARRPFHVSLLRLILSKRTFAQLVAGYLLLNVVLVIAELVIAGHWPKLLPQWTLSGPPGPDIKAMVFQISSFLIGALVGILGALSIAIALVTVLSDQDESLSDVRLYYDASLALPLFSSIFALLFVLAIQLLWPLQFLLHRIGLGTDLLLFKLVLTGIHIIWFGTIVCAAAHFVATTYGFVERSARTKMRKQYIANEVVPRQIRERLFQQYYLNIGTKIRARSLVSLESETGLVHIGFDMGPPNTIELVTKFSKPARLKDVRTNIVLWVVKSWQKRCLKAIREGNTPREAEVFPRDAWLWFSVFSENSLNGSYTWCKRRGGVPLSRLEKIALRFAFRFERIGLAS